MENVKQTVDIKWFLQERPPPTTDAVDRACENFSFPLLSCTVLSASSHRIHPNSGVESDLPHRSVCSGRMILLSFSSNLIRKFRFVRAIIRITIVICSRSSPGKVTAKVKRHVAVGNTRQWRSASAVDKRLALGKMLGETSLKQPPHVQMTRAELVWGTW